MSRGFYKFWNLDTTDRPETYTGNLPKGLPDVTEKMDGSLGIGWKYNNHTGIATRGSFTSEMAKWATNHLHSKYHNLLETLPYESTLLVEIIYPENAIVVNYDFADIVVLAVVYNATGWELTRDMLESWSQRTLTRPPLVPKFDKSLEQVIAENIHNKEGYVLSWREYDGLLPNKEVLAGPTRVKVKFPDYMRLHKLITGVSVKSLWKMLSTGVDTLTLCTEGLPEHFTEWVRQWTSMFRGEYAIIHYEAEEKLNLFLTNTWDEYYRHSIYTRKQAAEVFTKDKEFKSLLFMLLEEHEGKDNRHSMLDEQIWKMVWRRMKDSIKECDTFRKDPDSGNINEKE